jgi:AcrR family transcriptional regulator
LHRHKINTMVKRKKTDDGSAEQKIKEAARKLFTEKGFDAVKTRDIAAEAGINLALLNYYFRSKQKLFDIIMVENFESFVQQLIPVLGDEKLPLDEVLEKVTASYIDMLKSNPDLPFFIMNEMKSDSTKLQFVREKMADVRNGFIKRLENTVLMGKKFSQDDLGNWMVNFMGLVIFPFVARPMMMKVNNFSKKEFDALMEQRKKLIPVWMKAIMTAK